MWAWLLLCAAPATLLMLRLLFAAHSLLVAVQIPRFSPFFGLSFLPKPDKLPALSVRKTSSGAGGLSCFVNYFIDAKNQDKPQQGTECRP